MTRKDYIETAKVLNGYKDKVDFITLSDLALSFSEMFQNDNKRFDEQRFIDAVFQEGN
jgi:hypothetical protein